MSAQLFVQEKKSDNIYVRGSNGFAGRALGKVLSCLDPAPKLLYPKRHRDAWSCGYLRNPCFSFKDLIQPDIIHLHWVNAGMMSVKSIGSLSRPVVWTLHDSWPFTGGCHIPYDCLKFEERCGDCPQLRSGKERDLSRLVWKHKLQEWHGQPMQLVAPSSWLASTAKSSSLFKGWPVKVIPNGLDIQLFSPVSKTLARRRLGLPEKSRLILFSAMGGINNWNKGGALLKDSLVKLLKFEFGDCALVVTGNNRPIPKDFFPVKCIDMGRIDDDDEKKYLYSSVDVTAVPSRSESLGYVVMESMACGTPCVAFSVGGIPDLIDHQLNGFLAKPLLTDNFAEGIVWVLSDATRYQELSAHARNKIVDQFCHIKVAKRYQDLYLEVSARHREGS